MPRMVFRPPQAEDGMYLDHFKLRVKPFELLPDPEFLFPSAVHRKALAYLEYGIQEHSGFVLFTGEVGTGKTTLIRRLLDQIPERTTIAKIFNTQVNSAQLLRMINDDFGLTGVSLDKAEMLRELNEFLIDQYAAGRRSILIIDEAQNLGPAQLEEIRLLSNLETGHAKLLQIILVGQPELRDRLSSPQLIQLRQRILVHCHLSPLTTEDTEHYILHRLELAGNREALIWQDGVMELIHQATRGIPRLINILCDYVLLELFGAGRNDARVEDVSAILDHLDFEAQFWPTSDSPRTGGTAVSSDLAVMERISREMQENLKLLHKNILMLAEMQRKQLTQDVLNRARTKKRHG